MKWFCLRRSSLTQTCARWGVTHKLTESRNDNVGLCISFPDRLRCHLPVSLYPLQNVDSTCPLQFLYTCIGYTSNRVTINIHNCLFFAGHEPGEPTIIGAALSREDLRGLRQTDQVSVRRCIAGRVWTKGATRRVEWALGSAERGLTSTRPPSTAVSRDKPARPEGDWLCASVSSAHWRYRPHEQIFLTSYS